jgi:hypothetical protein
VSGQVVALALAVVDSEPLVTPEPLERRNRPPKTIAAQKRTRNAAVRQAAAGY